MPTIILQRVNNTLVPDSKEDLNIIKGFKKNVPIKAKITSVKKYRSLRQLRAFHAACRKICDNSNNPNLDTPAKVKTYVKLHCGFIEEDKLKGSVPCPKCNTQVEIVHWILKSLSFDESDHIEVCEFLDKAFPFMADLIGTTEEALLENLD